MKISKTKNGQSGQALVETCFMLPILFLLVINVVNFGGYFYAWISVAHATRSAAQYATTGPAYLGYGSANGIASVATVANVQQMAKDDLESLRNSTTTQKPTITVCTTAGTNTCSGMSEPESATSDMTTIDISYVYCPLVPFWDFPKLGIHLTLPSCTTTGGVSTGGKTVHRIAAMRMIQ